MKDIFGLYTFVKHTTIHQSTPQKKTKMSKRRQVKMEAQPEPFYVPYQHGSLRLKLTMNLQLIFISPTGEERVLGRVDPATGNHVYPEVVDGAGAHTEASDEDNALPAPAPAFAFAPTVTQSVDMLISFPPPA
jgi:hypothetical protein